MGGSPWGEGGGRQSSRARSALDVRYAWKADVESLRGVQESLPGVSPSAAPAALGIALN